MSIAPLALVVLAAFIHATWNLLAKRAAHAGAAFICAYNLAACICYLPWVAWLLWNGAVSWTLPVVCCVVASTLIHLAYSLCLQRGYQLADLSIVYPVARGTGPMLSSLGAFLLLGERASVTGLLGLFAVVAGIGLISTQGNLRAFRRPQGQAGIRWGTATGALIAAYTVVDAYGVKTLGLHPVVLDWSSNLLRCLLLAPLVLKNRAAARDRMKGKWLLALAVGALSPLSYILVLEAIRMGAPLSLVAPAREMSMMVGALLGMVVLREPLEPWRLGGCAVMILGVVLLGRA
jgi:drug/metabolite transporter (DMT)-like permease